MNIISSFDEYRLYYTQYHKLPYPQTTWDTKKEFTDRELQSKYRDYQNKIEKLNIKKDTIELSEYAQKVKNAMENVHKENNLKPYMEFFVTLECWQQELIKENMWMCPNKTFDACHYKERSTYPNMAYVEDNIVLLPRPLHQSLDNRCWIGTNKMISAEEHHKLWTRILGEERIKRLDEMSKSL